MFPLSPYRVKKIRHRTRERAFRDLQYLYEKKALIPPSPFLVTERYRSGLERVAEILIGLLTGVIALDLVFLIMIKILHLSL